MSTDPVVPPMWVRLLANLGAGVRARGGSLLEPLARAVTSELDAVDGVYVRGRGAVDLFDLDTSPRPGWLGQSVGVPYDRASSPDQQRAAVRSRGQVRGTPGALLAAARATLRPGSDQPPVVQLLERDGSAYRLTVRTYALETPDAAATLAALIAVKPVGLILRHVVLAGQDFHEVAEYGATFGMVRDSGVTFRALLERLPDDRDERAFQVAAAGTFGAATANTFARFLRPTLGRDRPTTVRTFGRLTTRTYGQIRPSIFDVLDDEGA